MIYRKYLIWLIVGPLVVALGLLSWQYMRHKALTDGQNRQNDNSGPQPFLYEDDQQEADPEAVKKMILAEAVKKFRTAKSFRVKIRQNIEGQEVTGQLEYVKPLRLRASLVLPDNQYFDTIIIGETVYVRQGLDQWEMTDNSFAKDFGLKFFASMLTSDDTPASFGIPDDAAIETKEDLAKKCTLYKTQYISNDNRYDIQFCIDDNRQIVSIKTALPEGEVMSEYQDYNALFLIERPRLPWLELRSPELEAASQD